MEKSAEVFSGVERIVEEIANLEKYVKTAFDTLDHQYQNYIAQINLLSELIEFQRKLIRFKSPEQAAHAIFTYINDHVPFDRGFIYFKISEEDDRYELITPEWEKTAAAQDILDEADISALINLIANRDMALLFSNVYEFQNGQMPWHKLRANSVILFPVRVRDQFLGFGLFIREKQPFSISHLSFINLNIGVFSLLLFQHYYFFRLKSRLFKQFKLKKILEEVKYAEYFEKGPLFIFTLDPRGIVLHTNAAALEKIELDEDVIVGEKFLNLLPPEHRKPFQNITNQMREGDVRFYKCPIISPAGTEFVLEFYITKMDLKERLTLMIIFAVDASREYHKEIQEKQKEVLDELGQLSQIMVGHLNNLLTILVPNVSLMKAHIAKDSELQKYLGIMEKHLNRTASFVQKFMNYDLQEIENGEFVNINEIIREIVAKLKEKFPETVAVRFSLDPSIPRIYVFPNRLQNLFKILAQNSLEAISGAGEITISTQLVQMKQSGLLLPHNFYLQEGTYVEIQFSDNGMGIDPRFLPHIFKPFFSTKVKNEGVGLGLFIAYHIVRDLKGEIFVKSKPNQGASFFIYLPIKGEREMHKMLPGMEEVLNQNPPAILVVDDEYNIRSMLKEILEMNGFLVYTAANGQEALNIFKKHHSEIELIVLDMVMPIMDGRQTFSEIKRLKPDQRFIIVSGYAEQRDLQEMLKKGAQAYLKKPFQIQEILNQVKTVLDTT